MGFRGEMHDQIGLVGGEGAAHRGGIGDIGADQRVARARSCRIERVFRGGVGHFVNIDNVMTGRCDQVPDNRGTDEAAATGNQNLHVKYPVCLA